MTTLFIMAVGAYLPISPLAHALGFVPLPPLYWLLLIVTLICYVGLTQIIKTWLIRKTWI
jgi:Mg2+-importing ATPase